MEIPDDVQRTIPYWVFPSGRPPNTQLSRPDGIIVLRRRGIPLEGRDSTNHPKDMNSRDRDIHLIELNFCSDTKPGQTLLTA
eukprot:1149510-Pelagomonas_calceolata.AAC.1